VPLPSRAGEPLESMHIGREVIIKGARKLMCESLHAYCARDLRGEIELGPGLTPAWLVKLTT
jgi:hypothetical protein